MMQNIKKLFDSAKKLYDGEKPSFAGAVQVGEACLRRISEFATISSYGNFRGDTVVTYHVAKADSEISRPFRKEMFVCDPDEYVELMASFSNFLKNIPNDPVSLAMADKAIYTTVMSFCICYDLWKRSSRKTPGTFFEVFMGGAFRQAFPTYQLGKHIKIDNMAVDEQAVIEEIVESEDLAEEDVVADTDSVATDIVLINPANQKGTVIPLKITTRERIVQPFAHQRILDSAFEGKYQSFLACISETQLDAKSSSVKQICVPGTVKLYQKHLAQLSGLYYCDIPQRYGRPEFSKDVIPVRQIGAMFGDLKRHLA